MSKLPPRAKAEISRFKGLGEMMPKTLYETTLAPGKRKLLRVSIPEGAQLETEQVMSDLLGKDPSTRAREILLQILFLFVPLLLQKRHLGRVPPLNPHDVHRPTVAGLGRSHRAGRSFPAIPSTWQSRFLCAGGGPILVGTVVRCEVAPAVPGGCRCCTKIWPR